MLEEEVWKQKYLDLLVNFDKSSQLLEQWHSYLSRVSIAADGVDPKLDDILRALRKAIREGSSEEIIQEQVDQISDLLLSLDEQKTTYRVEILKTLATLINLLNDLPLPRQVKKNIKSFMQRLDMEYAQRFHSELIEDYQKIMLSVFDWLKREITKPDKKEEASSLKDCWKNLFLRESPQKDIKKETTTVLSQELLEKIDEKPIPSLERETDSQPIINTLLRLLEHLMASPVSEKAMSLRNSLQECHSFKELPALIDAIAALVVEVINADQKSMEVFLEKLTERLHNINEGSKTYFETHKETIQKGKLINKDLQAHIEGIQHSFEQEKDMVRLEELVQIRLEKMATAIKNYANLEAQRADAAEQQVKILEEKLKTIQQESSSIQAHLQEQRLSVQRDPLTHLPNRLAYDERIEQELEAWKKTQENIFLVVADVDYFKLINDQYGHLAGDKVLKKIASLLENSQKTGDFIARYGGEEFVILLRGLTQEELKTHLESVRLQIQDCQFHTRGNPVAITLSFGVAQVQVTDTPNLLFNRADKSLYDAKNAGRNTIVYCF